MRIALMLPYSLRRIGGVQTAFLMGARELHRRGLDVTLFVPRNGANPSKTGELKVVADPGFRALRWNSPSGTGVDLTVSSGRSRTIRALRSGAFDVLHIHEPTAYMGRAVVAARLAPTVGTFHAAPQVIRGSAWLDRQLVRRWSKSLSYLDRATSVSNHAASRAQLATTVVPTIIPNAITSAASSHEPWYSRTHHLRSTPPQIVFIGRVEPRKRVDLLVRAVAILRRDNPELEFELVVAGIGSSRRTCQALAKKLGCPVTFLPHQTDIEQIELLRGAAIFCSPATSGESFGLAPAEALAVGCRVVVGTATGYRELFDGPGALSVAEGGAQGLAAKLRFMLLLDELPDDYQLWTETLLARCSVTAVVDAWLAEYGAAIASAKQVSINPS